MTMDIEGLQSDIFLVGNDVRFFGVIGIASVVGAALSAWILVHQYAVPITTVLIPFSTLVLVYFGVSVAISVDGGGLLEPFVLLFGPVLGFFSGVCSHASLLLPQSSPTLLCTVAGTSIPVFDFSGGLVLDIATNAVVSTLLLSILSVGLGRLLRNQNSSY